MLILRLILALLLAAGLASLPLSAAMAMAQAEKAQAALSASVEDCPCCKSTHPETCPLECCHLQAVSVQGWIMPEPGAGRFVEDAAERGADLSPRPDPPPP